MNSRVLASAVAVAFTVPLPVLAESGNVQIYGTINTDYERVQATGATPAGALAPGQLGATPTGVNAPARNRVTSNSSNIGFRGVEDLGGGLRAFFQVESAVGFDNQATFGANTDRRNHRHARIRRRSRHERECDPQRGWNRFREHGQCFL